MKRMLIAVCVLALLFTGCAASREGSPEEKTEDHFSFQAGEVTVTLNAPAGAILEALGQSQAYTKAESCGLCAAVDTYCCDGFFLNVQPDGEGEDRVTGFWFTDGSVKTPEGVGIGDSRDAVKTAYGSFSGDVYMRRKGEERMLILLDGDRVCSIQCFVDTDCNPCGGSAADNAGCNPCGGSVTDNVCPGSAVCPQPDRTPIPGS